MSTSVRVNCDLPSRPFAGGFFFALGCQLPDFSNKGTPGRVRFGSFELDRVTGELRKSGVRIKLQDQPFRVLRELTKRPGALFTREKLRERLWPDDTYVDFDQNRQRRHQEGPPGAGRLRETRVS